MAGLVEFFDRWQGVLIDKDLDKLLKVFHDDATVMFPGFAGSGKDQIRKLEADEIQKVKNLVIKKKSVIEDGNNVAVEWRFNFIYMRTGKEIQLDGASFITVENGLIKSIREYYQNSGPVL